MNWKVWVPLTAAVVLGLVAALVARDLVARNRVPAQSTKTIRVAVAKADIAPGQMVSADDVTLSALAAENIPAAAFGSTDQVAGRAAFVPILKGQVMLDSLLAPRGAGAGLAALVPDGMRAITLEINEFNGVAGLLLPGCRVDVIASMPDGHNGDTIARTVVQNLTVTAIGQRINGSPKPDDPAQQQIHSVTLLATPQQAESLELAGSSARYWLVLRSGTDNAQSPSTGITLAELRGHHRSEATDPFAIQKTEMLTPATTQPAAGPEILHRSVEVIRGGVESKTTFEIPKSAAGGLMTDVSSVMEDAAPGSK